MRSSVPVEPPAPRHRRRRARLPATDAKGAVGRPASVPQAEALALRLAFEKLPHGLCVFDGDDRLLLVNPRYAHIWGLPAALTRPGTPFADIMQATRGQETEASRGQPKPAPGSTGTRRREWQMEDGRSIEITVTHRADGSCVALHQDVTEQRHAQARIAHLAWHDALTGLPNRSRLRDELEALLGRTARGEVLALLLLDLDRFKPVNDTLGHAAGDALLRQVALRLRGCVRETDIVARIGGDEFAIVQWGATQPAAASTLARRVIEALAAPHVVAGHTVHVGVSVGVAIAPFDGQDPEVLQRHADLALFRAKADGRGTLRFFEPGMDAEARHRHDMEADLRRALERGEFELFYQPQVELRDQQVCGLEALLRWNHPRLGRIAPDAFMTLAEETGLIVPIGRWVLMQACRQACTWPADWRVAVNVSAVQFRQGALLRDVTHALLASGLPPQRLEVEVTEASLLVDPDLALDALGALRSQGVRVAMDDFGSGRSSLRLLRRFSFDRLKLDRSFVNDLGRDGAALALIRTVASMGQSLGISTTAEGVETAAQMAAVMQEGCIVGQGWHFSRPLTASAVQDFVQALHPKNT